MGSHDQQYDDIINRVTSAKDQMRADADFIAECAHSFKERSDEFVGWLGKLREAANPTEQKRCFNRCEHIINELQGDSCHALTPPFIARIQRDLVASVRGPLLLLVSDIPEQPRGDDRSSDTRLPSGVARNM